MESIERIKQDIIASADEKRTEFEETSSYIFNHPELAFEEYKSQAALCELLLKHGVDVTEACRQPLRRSMIPGNRGRRWFLWENTTVSRRSDTDADII